MNKFILFMMLFIISSISELKASDDYIDNSIYDASTSDLDMEMIEKGGLLNSFKIGTDQLLREKLWDNDKKAMTDLLTDQTDDGGLTLLMIAAAFGDLETVKEIIEKDTAIEPQILVKIKGINKERDHKYYKATSHFVYKQQDDGVFIRATSNHGYSALTYAVVGGHYDIAFYIVETLKKKLGAKEAAALINKKDNFGWSPVLYSVAFKPLFDSNFEKREWNYTNILSYLVINGGNIKVEGKNLYEGTLDIISICAKYAHLNIIKFLRINYQQIKRHNDYLTINKRFGSNQELDQSLTRATRIALNHKDKASTAIERNKYTDIITELSAWSQDLCMKSAFSHYRLAAGSHRQGTPDYFGAYNFILSYTFDGNKVIGDVKIKEDEVLSDGVKNSEKFKFKYLVRYSYTSLTEDEEEDFGDNDDYKSKNLQEAYVIIKWSYWDNTRPYEPTTFDEVQEGTYTDSDDGISIIRIDTSVNPTSEVVKPGGNILVNRKNSGLTKITK